MKPEDSPITNDEWLLRRVPPRLFYETIDSDAFKPRTTGRDPDLTGISLYRLDCLTSPIQILDNVDEEKRKKNGIVKIPVTLLYKLNLTVRVKLDDIPGHVEIPELDVLYKKLKNVQWILEQLALEAEKPENKLKYPLREAV